MTLELYLVEIRCKFCYLSNFKSIMKIYEKHSSIIVENMVRWEMAIYTICSSVGVTEYQAKGTLYP